MLEAIALTLLFGTVLTMTAAGVGFGLTLRALAQRSRLHPSIETGAPISWLWWPGAAARLHRRLRSSVAAVHTDARSGAPDDSGTGDLAAAVLRQAAGIDRELIVADRVRGPHRRAALRRLRGEVRQLERLSFRLQQHRSTVAGGGWTASSAPRRQVVADLHARLDVLAQAHAELLAIEQAETASDPDALLARIARSGARPVTVTTPAPR